MGFFSKLFKGITNLIGDVIGFLVGADFDDQSQAEGVLVNKSSNIASIPVIYGTRKVGGTRVFLSTSGGDNEYLYMALVLCEGPIQSIGDVYINDTISTDPKFNGLVTLDKKLGASDQQYSTLLAGATDTWGSDHRLRGVAYLGIRLKWNQDVFGSIPDIQCVVSGRKVYDPRNANHDSSDPSTWAFSKNPALCLRDYMTNTQYGKGLTDSQINDTAFSAAANVCDTTVTEYQDSGTTIPLLECNAVLDTNKTLFDNVKILLQGMRGLLPFQDGQYSLLVDAAAPAGTKFRLDADNITGALQVTAAGKNKKFNRVRAKFVNPNANWQEDSVDWPPNDATYTEFLSEDNGEELLRNVTLNTITNYYSARDLARVICRASREHQLTVELTALPEALTIAVGDVVELEHESLGWTVDGIQDFRVLAMGLQENGEVKLTLQEYTNVYTWQAGPEEGENNESTTPNPFEVAAPTGLSLTQGVNVAEDGSNIPYLDVAFTAADDAFVVEYIINAKPSGFDPSEVVMSTASLTTAQVAGTDPITYLFNPAFVTTYSVEVWAVNDAGVRSDSITGSIAVTGDTTPPAAVTALTATGGYKSVSIKWSNPSDADYSWATVERRVYNTGSYVSIADVYGKPSGKSQYYDGGLADNVRYQYRVTAYDWSQNAATTSPTASDYTDEPIDDTISGSLEPRSANGYLYYQYSTADTVNSLSAPSASNYNWTTGLFGNLSANWGHEPPDVNPIGTAGAGLKYWAVRYYVTENVYNGTQSVNISTPFNSFLFDGLATFSNLNTELANASSSLLTTIDGGLIKTGEIDLANQTGMNIHQGKSSYGSNTAGFWLGNDNGTAKFNIGDSDDYLKWTGSYLEAKRLSIVDDNNRVILDANGSRADGGSNMVFNGDFWSNYANWANNSGTVTISGGEAYATTNEQAICVQYIPCTQSQELYLYCDATGNYGYMQIVYYNSSQTYMTGVAQTLGFSNMSPTWSNSRAFRIAKVTVPTGAAFFRISFGCLNYSGNSATFYEVGVSRVPPVIDPDFASTYIRNLSVDTLQIAGAAVSAPDGVSNTLSGNLSSGTSDLSFQNIGNSVSVSWDAGDAAPQAMIVIGSFSFGGTPEGSTSAASPATVIIRPNCSFGAGGSVVSVGRISNSFASGFGGQVVTVAHIDLSGKTSPATVQLQGYQKPFSGNTTRELNRYTLSVFVAKR